MSQHNLGWKLPDRNFIFTQRFLPSSVCNWFPLGDLAEHTAAYKKKKIYLKPGEKDCKPFSPSAS